MLINILGNGPSLKNYSWPKDLPTIGTNWIFNNSEFYQLNNYYYVVYDENFFIKNDPTWLKMINRLSPNKVFIPSHWKSKKFYKKFQNFDEINTKNNLIAEYIRLYWNSVENVIFKCAIPLALHLKSNKINLYGCDFDYNIKKDGSIGSSSYFYKKNNHHTDFTHTKNTALNWSEESKKTFYKIKDFLNNFNINIQNKSNV